MKICTSCQFPNEDNAFFCENCGNPEFKPAAAKTDAPAFAPAGKKCPQCGAIIEDGDLFCGECGYRVDGPKPSQPAFKCLCCGKELAPGQEYCSCGTRKGEFLPTGKAAPQGKTANPPVPPVVIPGTVSGPNPPKLQKQKKEKPEKNGNGAKVIIIICAVLIVAALAFIAYMIFGSGFDFGSKKTDDFSEYDIEDYSPEYETDDSGNKYEDDSPQVHTYDVIADDVSWYKAKSECERRGGHLASINSREEYYEICRLADESGLKYIWLGARIYSVSDDFDEWITGEPMDFTKWYPGEPSKADFDGTEEFYLCMWNIDSEGWTFNDQRNEILLDKSVKPGTVGYVIEYDY